MRHVDVVVQKRFRADATEKHGRVFVEKAAHQIFGRDIIIEQAGRVLDRVKQKNAQIGRFTLDQINVVGEFHLRARRVDRCGWIGFAAVVQRHGDVADRVLHIIERPFAIGRPLPRHVANHQRAAWLEIMFVKIVVTDVVHHVDGGKFKAHISRWIYSSKLKLHFNEFFIRR